MKKTHRTILFTIISMSILTVFIVWGFYTITKRGQSQNEAVPKTEVEKLIKKDIDGNYPGTPREVMKLYCRITKCMYNDEITDDQLEQLAIKLRLLFDDELLKNNEKEAFLKNLSADVLTYHENEERISSYEVQLNSDTEYGTIKNDKYATLKVSFLVQHTGKKKSFTKTYEQFLLRQDGAKRWKIVHWQLASEDNLE